MTKLLFLSITLVLLAQDGYSLVPKEGTSAEQAATKAEVAKSSSEILSVATVAPAVVSEKSSEVVDKTPSNKQKSKQSQNEEMIIDQVHDPAVVDYGMPAAPAKQQEEEESWEDYYEEEDSSEEYYRYVYDDAAYAQPNDDQQPLGP